MDFGCYGTRHRGPRGEINCGEGIYPRWVAKPPPAFWQVNQIGRIDDCCAVGRG